MTENEKTRLRNAEANVKTLEKRIITLEGEMLLCLKFMRVQAEKMAKEKDPNFKSAENHEA
jgi:hypothetical protein